MKRHEAVSPKGNKFPVRSHCRIPKKKNAWAALLASMWKINRGKMSYKSTMTRASEAYAIYLDKHAAKDGTVKVVQVDIDALAKRFSRR